MKINKYKIIILTLIIFFIGVNRVDAAKLYIVPETNNLGVGQEFFVDIRVDTEEDYINASEAKIKFSNDILEVVDIDTNNSVFRFWIKEPKISDDKSNIGFIGGSSKGISGNSLQIFRIKFKTIASGDADIKIEEGIISAADGRGTNILNSIGNINISIGSDFISSTLQVDISDVVEAP